MDPVVVDYIEKPDLKNTILIEGLPGIGLVGKLATDHMLDELKAKKFARIYSPHLPPQVTIRDDGTVHLVDIELHYVKGKKHDLILLIGDFQGITPESQYQISERIVDIGKEFNVVRIYTLGGLGTGTLTKSPKVYGAATSKKLVDEHKPFNVIFKGGGAIFGASGLLLGLGERVGIDAVCLMGETHGQIIDAKSAEAVLEILTKVLEIKLDMTKLDNKAKETERQMAKISKMVAAHDKMMNPHQKAGSEEEDDDDTMSYIR